MADEKKQVNATWKQKSFAKAIATELDIKDFDIKNYDTKEKCFKFIEEHLDEFHRVKTERANGGVKKESEPTNTDLPF